VESASGSAAKPGIVGGATLIGSLLMLLPAGVIADRYPRQRILIITSLAQLVVVGTVVPAAQLREAVARTQARDQAARRRSRAPGSPDRRSAG
jgi:hypothetical protein